MGLPSLSLGRTGLLASLFGLAILTMPAQAAEPSPEIARGVQWLGAQLLPDGGVHGEEASIATPQQARTETAMALAHQHTTGADQAAWGREYLVNALGADGRIDTGSRASDLEVAAFALTALRSGTDTLSVNAVTRLSTWLLQQQGTGGGWEGDLHSSAMAFTRTMPVMPRKQMLNRQILTASPKEILA